MPEELFGPPVLNPVEDPTAVAVGLMPPSCQVDGRQRVCRPIRRPTLTLHRGRTGPAAPIEGTAALASATRRGDRAGQSGVPILRAPP